MKKIKKIEVILCTLFVVAANAWASGNGGMVWEKPATSISKSISGSVAGIVALIAIVVAALTWTFTDGGSLMGKAIKMVIGFAIVGGAAVFLSSVFGISTGGGMLI